MTLTYNGYEPAGQTPTYGGYSTRVRQRLYEAIGRRPDRPSIARASGPISSSL